MSSDGEIVMATERKLFMNGKVITHYQHSNNSPRKTLSRLMHSDYFDRYSYLEKEFEPTFSEHLKKCKHPKCIARVQHIDDLVAAIIMANYACGGTGGSNGADKQCLGNGGGGAFPVITNG